MRAGPLLVICVILVALGCLFWSFQKSSWRPVQHNLPDGTVIRIEKATYGAEHRYSGSRFADKIFGLLPRRFKFLIKISPGASMSTAPNTLVLWMTVDSTLAGSTNVFSPRQNRFWAQDDHGCLFLSSHWSSSGPAGSNVIGIALEAFPRNQRHFSFGAGSTTGVVFLITNVLNPFFTHVKSWKPQPLPQKLTNSNLIVEVQRLGTLQRRDLYPGAPDNWCFPYIRIVRPLDEALWQAGPVFFCDPHGNRSSHQLCTNEAAWKIEAHFFRNARATFAPDEIWSITNIPVPQPGAVTSIVRTNVLKDCLISVLKLQAPTPEQLAVIPDPHMLSIRMSHIGGFPKVLVRVTDDLGQKITTLEERNPMTFMTNSSVTFKLYPATNSTSLNLKILVQQSVAFDFFVAPPQTVSGGPP